MSNIGTRVIMKMDIKLGSIIRETTTDAFPDWVVSNCFLIDHPGSVKLSRPTIATYVIGVACEAFSIGVDHMIVPVTDLLGEKSKYRVLCDHNNGNAPLTVKLK